MKFDVSNLGRGLRGGVDATKIMVGSTLAWENSNYSPPTTGGFSLQDGTYDCQQSGYYNRIVILNNVITFQRYSNGWLTTTGTASFDTASGDFSGSSQVAVPFTITMYLESTAGGFRYHEYDSNGGIHKYSTPIYFDVNDKLVGGDVITVNPDNTDYYFVGGGLISPARFVFEVNTEGTAFRMAYPLNWVIGSGYNDVNVSPWIPCQYVPPAFNATWSGNSTYTYLINPFGFEVSGNLMRHVDSSNGISYGGWITSNQDGTFTGNSTRNATFPSGYETIGNTIRTVHTELAGAYYGAWLTFDISNGFSDGLSDGASINSKHKLRGSGGLLRAEHNTNTAPYISLT